MYESFPYASQNAPTLKSNSDLGCISFMFFTIFIMLMFYSYSGLCEHWQTKSLPVLLLLCLFSHYYSSTKVVAYLLLNTDVGIQTRGRTASEPLSTLRLLKQPPKPATNNSMVLLLLLGEASHHSDDVLLL